MAFLRAEFSIGVEVSKSELSRGNFTRGEFARIQIQSSFYLTYFLVGYSVLRMENSGGIVWGKLPTKLRFSGDFPRENSPWGNYQQENILHGEFFCGRNFPSAGRGNFRENIPAQRPWPSK